MKAKRWRYEKLALGGWVVSDNRAGDAFICDSEAAALRAVVILNTLEADLQHARDRIEELLGVNAELTLRVQDAEAERDEYSYQVSLASNIPTLTARIEALEQEDERLKAQVDELSEIIADKYTEVGRLAVQLVDLLEALKTIKSRAAVVVEETKGQDWFSQNAYAKADDTIRAYERATGNG